MSRSLLLLCALTCSACIEVLDQEESTIGELERDCVVPAPSDVASWGAPVGLEYPDGSLWIWDAIELSDGATAHNASAFVMTAEEVCASGPSLARAGDGKPLPLFGLSAAEEIDNSTRTDGRRLQLVPSGGFVHEQRGYVFYAHILFGPGFFDAEELGTGLCVIEPGEQTCSRIANSAGDTVLWQKDDRLLNHGGFVDGDRALVYGCRQYASLAAFCTVNGAPLDRLTEPAAYQVWNVFDGWVDDALSASVLIDELGSMTVAPYEGSYLMTTLALFETSVSVRRSKHAVDGFGHEDAAFDVVPTEFPFLGGGREHAGLRRGESLTIHLSYSSAESSAPGLHLATFRFFGTETGDPYQ